MGGEKVQPTVGRGRKPPLGPEKRNCWLGPLSLSFPLTHTLPGGRHPDSLVQHRREGQAGIKQAFRKVLMVRENDQKCLK